MTLKSVEAFDGKSWSEKAFLNTARFNIGLASYNGSLYVAGGADIVADSEKAFNSTEVFDGTSWSPGPDLPSERYSVELAAY